MANPAQMKKWLSKIQIVRPPRHRLSTFGSSEIRYSLITDVIGYPDRARLRTGTVKAEKPAIITADSFTNRFHGFGNDAENYAKGLVSKYGQALRGLEYQFRNNFHASRLELTHPDKLTDKMVKDFDERGEYRHAILRGADKVWELSIMKFIIEETLSSFESNVQELNERGFFEEDRSEKRQHREIQQLIRRAKLNPELVPVLGKKLKEYGLFEEYQDEFFRIVQS